MIRVTVPRESSIEDLVDVRLTREDAERMHRIFYSHVPSRYGRLNNRLLAAFSDAGIKMADKESDF